MQSLLQSVEANKKVHFPFTFSFTYTFWSRGGREDAKEANERLRQLPDELRDNWNRAYQFLFVNAPPNQYVAQFHRLKEQTGMTDRLIVAVLERAISLKRRHPLAWVQQVITGLVPYGITTPEEWAAHEEAQEAEDERQLAEREAKKRKGREAACQSTPPLRPRSNVILQGDKKPDSYYDHIFKRFDENPGGGSSGPVGAGGE